MRETELKVTTKNQDVTVLGGLKTRLTKVGQCFQPVYGSSGLCVCKQAGREAVTSGNVNPVLLYFASAK